MESVVLNIGTVVVVNGRQCDDLRPVEFVGELVASRTEYGYSDRGYLSDTRGVDESLYRAEGGRLLVYTEDWSRWQGEPNHYTLREVTEADLAVGGDYEALGREAGFGRPLTIDEALSDGA
ncbi:MAG TPA: hypothetical protein PLJ35_14770 [Anaerolineae bacterium]|nr:hypothetical protein [Anaerolineae bacterium]HOR00075.1 hypothetical protein [Anaerolineae bacterium]HPL79568.1 hypothetical protein [Burkholderiaceae bacterium]